MRVALALALSGCLSTPSYDDTMYKCVESSLCPAGFSCVNGTCTTDPVMDMVRFEGPFDMGCPIGTSGCPSTWTEHPVELAPFAIQKYEVRQRDYADCVMNSGCADLSTLYDPLVHPDAPVRNLSWENARIYCDSLGLQLPTEAQWEMAARTNDDRYPWGDEIADCATRANFEPCPTDAPENVDARPPSKTGLYQMAGNVREWVQDYFRDDFYSASTGVAQNPNNTVESGTRVLRGGSYATGEPTLQVWYRDQGDKVQAIPDAGVRCAKRL